MRPLGPGIPRKRRFEHLIRSYVARRSGCVLTCRSVKIMEEAGEVQRAIGRYRPPKSDLVAATCAGIIWIALGMMRSSYALLWVTAGIYFIAIAWLVPVVVINARGVRLVRRFRFIHWVNVTKVFQPGPGDPVRVQLSSGKRVVLYGVDRDRVPVIVVLATRSADGPDTSAGPESGQPTS